MLKENFVILHCKGRNSPIIHLILVAWEYYGSKSKKIHVLESSDYDGKPKLEYESGKSVEGAAAVVTYLLLSGKPKHDMVDTFESTKAQIFQWIFYALNEVKPPVYSWVTESKGFQRSKTETINIMGRINELLLTRTYLVGERISCADITLVSILLPAVQTVQDKNAKTSYQNLYRWMNTCLAQPEFIHVLGTTTLS
jgi:elongation factor 1-gamma